MKAKSITILIALSFLVSIVSACSSEDKMNPNGSNILSADSKSNGNGRL